MRQGIIARIDSLYDWNSTQEGRPRVLELSHCSLLPIYLSSVLWSSTVTVFTWSNSRAANHWKEKVLWDSYTLRVHQTFSLNIILIITTFVSLPLLSLNLAVAITVTCLCHDLFFRPCHGLIFLFKWRAGEEPAGSVVQDSRLDTIFFAKQVCVLAYHYACLSMYICTYNMFALANLVSQEIET